MVNLRKPITCHQCANEYEDREISLENGDFIVMSFCPSCGTEFPLLKRIKLLIELEIDKPGNWIVFRNTITSSVEELIETENGKVIALRKEKEDEDIDAEVEVKIADKGE